jgi:hypothetical protein
MSIDEKRSGELERLLLCYRNASGISPDASFPRIGKVLEEESRLMLIPLILIE